VLTSHLKQLITSSRQQVHSGFPTALINLRDDPDTAPSLNPHPSHSPSTTPAQHPQRRTPSANHPRMSANLRAFSKHATR